MKIGNFKTHCEYCGANGIDLATGRWNHPVESCPAIEEIEYFADGKIKRVKKRAPERPTSIVSCWPADHVVPQPHQFTVTTTAPHPNSKPIQGQTT